MIPIDETRRAPAAEVGPPVPENPDSRSRRFDAWRADRSFAGSRIEEVSESDEHDGGLFSSVVTFLYGTAAIEGGTGMPEGDDVAGLGLSDVSRVLGEPALAAFEASRLRSGLARSSGSEVVKYEDDVAALGDPL